jgi:Rrf2 family protein
MIFTTKAGYGLRAMVRLAKNKSKKPYSLAKIAQKEGVSLAYLERLMACLKKSGLVKSVKGVSGGYCLVKSPAKITVYNVVQAVEGTTAASYCVVQSKRNICPVHCLTKKVWKKLQKQIDQTLRSIKLSDLIR